MNNLIPIVESGSRFSSFYFYNHFLRRVAEFYRQQDYNYEIIAFSLIIEDDQQAFGNKYYIDPITLPLIVSLSEQLSKYHSSPLPLILSNNKATRRILSFLDQADFFHLVGLNQNPNFPRGKNILFFREEFLGDFGGLIQKPEHKLRGYSLSDDQLSEKIKHFDSERQRDYLVEYYTYKVKQHFGVLLNSTNISPRLEMEFVDILSELITNGVLHSGSDAYALMFSNYHKTSFSISDNGKGLYQSLLDKDTGAISYYEKFRMFKGLKGLKKLKIDEQIENSLLAIFETLYYSMLKDRKGLFDLMCNVVIKCDGYFRLHNENAQIIVSARMSRELEILSELRREILDLHTAHLFGKIITSEYSEQIAAIANKTESEFVRLSSAILDNYHEDTQYSSIRLFEVKFKGVHVEVEIPNVV